MQALITYHLISKIREVFYSDHLEYDLPQDEVDESAPTTFQQYLANMTAKTVKYSRDQLFYAISRDNDPTTVQFMYFPHRKLEATQVLNILFCILSEELLVNPNNVLQYQS